MKNVLKAVLNFFRRHPLLLVAIVLVRVLFFGISFVAELLEDTPYENVADQDGPAREIPESSSARDGNDLYERTGGFVRDGNGLYEWTGGFVLDAAGMLSDEQNKELSGYLLKLNDTTSVQIAVLTLQTTGNEPIHDFAVRQFEKWQLGQKGVDNGALLTAALADRKMDITTGDGTEGVLTDILCKRILNDVMAPAFREEKYGEGIISAVHNMAGIITKDGSLVTIQETNPDDDDFSLLDIFLFFMFIVFISYMIWVPRRLLDIIFNHPHSVKEFCARLFIPDLIRNGSFRSEGGGSSYRSGGGGHTSGGGASSSW